MSADFENLLYESFERLDYKNFKVNLSSHRLFVCGGEIDVTSSIPPSFRDRFVSFSGKSHPHIHDSIVLAEAFKDYFKDNAYPDLLVFEDEIASISSVVVIFLESPGSLVELGMFCTKPNFYKKLVIVVPQDEVKNEDSFIYLGPLENIKKKESNSVAIYPWPDPNDAKYDKSHLEDLCDVIDSKLSSLPTSSKFNIEDTSHLSLFIADIIRISYPVLFSEIEFALLATDLAIEPSRLTRHIYLLSKMGFIDSLPYSGYRYYYPTKEARRFLVYGRMKVDQTFDEAAFRMSLIQSYMPGADIPSRKRRSAMSQIYGLLVGGETK